MIISQLYIHFQISNSEFVTITKISISIKRSYEVVAFYTFDIFIFSIGSIITGGAVAQLVERATPGEEVPGSIPAMAARSLLVG